MSKKIQYGCCIFFQNNHYFIPFGTANQSKKGDYYVSIGDKKKGGHISIHSSGEKHYRENDGFTISLTNEDLFQNVITDISQLRDMKVPERKFVINMIKKINEISIYGGCFDPNCKNKMGFAINYNILFNDLVDYLNSHQKIVKQLWGEPVDNVDNEETDNEENEKWAQIINRMEIEKVPECEYCNDRPRITYNKKKKKYVRNKCPRCQGLGFNLEHLEKYKIN